MSFLKALRGKNSPKQKRATPENDVPQPPPKQVQYEDPWNMTSVAPEAVVELLRCCSTEIKTRGLSSPFLLLPFRPTTEGSTGRSFIRQFFSKEHNKAGPLRGERLARELRLTDIIVLCSVLKWVWARIPGGVVSWEVYELFKVGETDSEMSRSAFTTFIPISADSKARTSIIFDFFDLLAAIAANGKTNGLGGLKLSRLAGWWAFEHGDTGLGFEGGYQSWIKAADAASHLFFAHLRSLSPGGKGSTVSVLPISLQQLLNATEYPPVPTVHLRSTTTKVVMTVETVSPTPFALLRRARNFQFRDDDLALQEFSDYEDPVQSLTEECKRVLKCISSANSSSTTKSAPKVTSGDQSWNRFQDMGFSVLSDSDSDGDIDEDSVFGTAVGGQTFTAKRRHAATKAAQNRQKTTDVARPQTPSWADFMASGFSENNPEVKAPPPMFISPDQLLPAIESSRAKSSQSTQGMNGHNMVPGELAGCGKIKTDDAFWWVWMTSLAPEESAARKAVFGRCAMIETVIQGCGWIVIEEQVKGAVPDVLEGDIYLATTKKDKKSKRSFLTRRKSASRNEAPTLSPPVQSQESSSYLDVTTATSRKRMTISAEQEATIKSTAANLRRKQEVAEPVARPRPNPPDRPAEKTNTATSLFQLQPVIVSEASPAMKWANNYDKQAIREAYLGGATTFGDRQLPNVPSTNSQVSLVTSNNASTNITSPTPPPKSIQTSPNSKMSAPSIIPEPQPSPLLKDDMFQGTFMQASSANGTSSPELSEQATSSLESSRRNVVSPIPTIGSDETPDKKKAGRFRKFFGKKDTDTLPVPLASPNDSSTHLAEPDSRLGRRPSLLAKKVKSQQSFNTSQGKPMNVVVKRVQEPIHMESFQTARTSPPNSPSHIRMESIDIFNQGSKDAHEIIEPELEPELETQEPISHVPEPEIKEEKPVKLVVQNGTNHSTPEPSFETPRHESETYEHVEDKTVSELLQSDYSSSQFNHGPLVEQPAFIPDTPTPRSVSPEDTPNLAMHDYGTQHFPRSSALSIVSDRSEEEFAPAPLPVPHPELESEPAVQDRWAQIRKNAAERAKMNNPMVSTENLAIQPKPLVQSKAAFFENRQLQEKPQLQTPPKLQQTSTLRTQQPTFPVKSQFPVQPAQPAVNAYSTNQQGYDHSSIDQSADDGETSGEETIESRVARIKARVAELTGNLDAGNSAARY